MQCEWQVEIDPYCQRVLAKHWPSVPRYGDIKECGKHNLKPVDLICGGFPCQDVSYAGTGDGIDGERSGLWFEMFRIICELRPRFVLVENVAALLNRGAGRVLGNLASIGFDAEWETLRAQDFGAAHRRERLFIVAYSNQINGEKGMGIESNRTGKIFKECDRKLFPIWLQTADQFIGMDDGVPAKVYRDRVGSLGNAVVPQVVEVIGRAIMESVKEKLQGLSKRKGEKICPTKRLRSGLKRLATKRNNTSIPGHSSTTGSVFL